MSDRQVEYRILVSLKEHRGILGSKITKREEFWFCAENGEIARQLASSNMKSKGYPCDEVLLQVLDAIPFSREVFPEHPEIKSLKEYFSEVEETEAVL